MVETNRIESKGLIQLKRLVGLDVQVTLRSVPEAVLVGVLNSFHLDQGQFFLVIEERMGLRFVNFADVSVLREVNGA